MANFPTVSARAADNRGEFDCMSKGGVRYFVGPICMSNRCIDQYQVLIGTDLAGPGRRIRPSGPWENASRKRTFWRNAGSENGRCQMIAVHGFGD